MQYQILEQFKNVVGTKFYYSKILLEQNFTTANKKTKKKNEKPT